VVTARVAGASLPRLKNVMKLVLRGAAAGSSISNTNHTPSSHQQSSSLQIQEGLTISGCYRSLTFSSK
jgi:hypothetical protein